MADEIDRASVIQDTLFSFRLQEVRRRSSQREAQPTGTCYYCQEPLGDKEKLFCDSDCRDDYNYIKSRGR